MPGMRNPAHLQANPTLAEMWPAEGYHYRRDHFYESCCFQAALSRFCSVRRTVRPFVEPFTGPRVQKDGGVSWALNAITPVPRMTCDITHAMATGESHPRGDLHAGTLDCSSGVMLDESESVDVASSATMNVQSMRGNVDQPFVRALGVS